MEIKLTWWFVYEWGKPTRQKPHRVILRSPLSKFNYYHNKRLQVKESQYLIPTYSWTLTPIPNWTCSVVTISPFDARLPVRDYPIAWIPVHDFNHQLEKELATNFFSSSQQWRSRRFLVIKPYSAQIEQLLHKNDELGQNCVSGHNLFKQILLNTCAACEHFDGP